MEATKTLRWPSFAHDITDSFTELDTFADVTFIIGDRKLTAHKLILSSCSPFFKMILSEYPPYVKPKIILPDIDYDDLVAIVKYIYTGEVLVSEEKFSSVLQAAECFQIQSLIKVENTEENYERNHLKLDETTLSGICEARDDFPCSQDIRPLSEDRLLCHGILNLCDIDDDPGDKAAKAVRPTNHEMYYATDVMKRMIMKQRMSHREERKAEEHNDPHNAGLNAKVCRGSEGKNKIFRKNTKETSVVVNENSGKR